MKKKMNMKNVLYVAMALAAYIILSILLNREILSRQYTSVIVPIMINIILAVSLNLTTGFLGELTLGHGGFMAVGAYVGALITLHMDQPMYVEFTLALVLGGVTAAAFGLLIGIPVLRLKGDYLAIVTLGFGEIIRSVVNSLKITNGATGLRGIPFYSTHRNFTLVYIIMIVSILLICNMVNSRQGRAICAIRDNDIAAESVGIPVSKYKVLAFVVAAFFAGVAGVLYGHNWGAFKPSTFDYTLSIEILVIVVLGGMGNIKGSVIAAILLTLIPEMLRSTEELQNLLYAIVLIAIMILNASNLGEKLFSGKKLPKIQKGD